MAQQQLQTDPNLPTRPEEEEVELTGLAAVWDLIRRVTKHPQGLAGAIMVFGLIFAAIFAPWIATHDPSQVNVPVRLSPPSVDHIFGTDHLGRDVFSRTIYGSRVSVLAGFLATSIAVVIGTFWGIAAGYFGGRIDNVLMRTADAWIAFPGLVLMIAFVAIFGPGLVNALVAIGLSASPIFARQVRGQVLSIRERDFVEATRAQGANHWRITIKHILPNIMAPIIVWASLGVGGNILAETGLSFLGLGTQPPTPSWGSMVNQGNTYLRLAPWIAFFPGLAVFLTVLGTNLLGDALRDTLDPRLRGVL